MPPPRRLAVAGALIAALTGGLIAATGTQAAVAAPVPTGAQADFNGDGYPDLAAGAPLADVGGRRSAGAVVVLYGSADGLSSARRTVVHQDSSGVPGAAEAHDFFGTALASADLDGDGYTDLAVGAEREAVGDKEMRGSTTVLWGGPKGLSGGAVLPLPSALPAGSLMGRDAATGDFDRDGHADLTVIGRNDARTYYGPIGRTGSVPRHHGENTGTVHEVIAGDLSGDDAAERLYPSGVDGDHGGAIEYLRWTGGTRYATTDLTAADGEAGAVGDVDGDGYGDLVLGDRVDPSVHRSGGHLGGQITVWYGGPEGPDPAQRPAVVHQDTPGVPGGGEAGDAFGASVSVGDIDGDGYADVAVGAPGEDAGGRDTGAVTVLYGSASGLTASGSRFIDQDTSGVPGGREADDRFGEDVRLGDVTGDGRADLAVGASEEDGRGALWLLRGSASGVTTDGAFSVTARGAGLTVSGQGWFGSVLATAAEQPRTAGDDFNGDGYRDTVVGAPDATVGGHTAAGAVTVLYGGPSGPSAARGLTLTQSSPGIPGGPEPYDRFGASVASADLDGDGFADLAVAAPREDIGDTRDLGMVTVVWGGPRGLSGGVTVGLSSAVLGYGGDGAGCLLGTGLAAVGGPSHDRPELLVAGACSAAGLHGPFTRGGKPAGSHREDGTPSVEDAVSGDLGGDRTADHVLLSAKVPGQGQVYVNPGRTSSGVPQPLPADASSADLGDVNADGLADLVAGAPNDPGGTFPDGSTGGRIMIWYGGPGGIDASAAPSVVLHQDSPGIPGTARAGDAFGASVSVGDIDGDGTDDIAVGVPGKDVGGSESAGSVVVIPNGGTSGPDVAGSFELSQDTSYVPGVAEDEDAFGSSVRLADANGDGRADLVVGAPGENTSQGGVWFFAGYASGSSSDVNRYGSYSIMGGRVGVPTGHGTGWSAELAP